MMPKFLIMLAPDDGQAGGESFETAASEATSDTFGATEQSETTRPQAEVAENWLDIEDEGGKKHSFKSRDEFLKQYKNMMMLQSDYTRKRQADSESKKQWEQERDSTMKEIMQHKTRYDDYNKFLKENPHIHKQLMDLRKKGTTPDVAVMKAQAYADEKYAELQKKLDEFENKDKEREKQTRREKTIANLKSRYEDFDSEHLDKEFSYIDPQNPEHIYEVLYHAMKGKMNPADLERKFAQSAEQKKKARLMPGGSGAKPSSDKAFGNLDDAVAAALNEM